MTENHRPDPTAAPRLDPDRSAKVIETLGELDNVPPGVAVRVKMEGPITPPWDEIGSSLDRAYRVSLRTPEIETDGSVRSVSEAARTVAAELNYRHLGHLYAGRHEPDPRMRKIDRDIRMEWHLRALKLAGLDDLDVRQLHEALDLPDRGIGWEESCDEMDRHNEATSRASLSGEMDGVPWRIEGPVGFHWPAFRLVATTPDGREISSRMDLRDYVAAHLSRMPADSESERSAAE